MYNINICILYYTIRACVGEGERGCHHRYPVAGVHPGKRVCDTRVCCIIYIHMSTHIYTHENTTKNTQEFVHRTRGPRLPNPQPNPSNFNTKTPKLTMTGLYIYTTHLINPSPSLPLPKTQEFVHRTRRAFLRRDFDAWDRHGRPLPVRSLKKIYIDMCVCV